MKIYDLTHLSHVFEQSFFHCKFFTTFKSHNIMWKDTDSLWIFMSNKTMTLTICFSFVQSFLYTFIFQYIQTELLIDIPQSPF